MKIKKKVVRTYKTMIHGEEVEVKVYEAYTKEEFDAEEKKLLEREHELTLHGQTLITEIDEQKIKKIMRELH